MKVFIKIKASALQDTGEFKEKPKTGRKYL